MWPMLEVVCRGSCPSTMFRGLMSRKASMTTFPFTDCIGSTTTATERGSRDSKDFATTIGQSDWMLFGERGTEGTHLLRIDIHIRQPASKSRMRVVPPHNSFWSIGGGVNAQSPKDSRTQHAHRPVCLSPSIIFVWNTWSTDSTVTVVPDCGMAKTSITCTVYSSMNSPSMRPMTSMGTPARPCFNIYDTERRRSVHLASNMTTFIPLAKQEKKCE